MAQLWLMLYDISIGQKFLKFKIEFNFKSYFLLIAVAVAAISTNCSIPILVYYYKMTKTPITYRSSIWSAHVCMVPHPEIFHPKSLK